MSLNFAGLKEKFKDLEAELIQDHVDRLDHEYFQLYSEEQIHADLSAIAGLEKGATFDLRLSELGDGVALNFVSLDFFGLHSILTGVLFLCGYSIQKGSYFSYSEAQQNAYPKDRLAFFRKLKNIDMLILSKPVGFVKEEAEQKLSDLLKEFLELFHQKGMSEVRFKLHTKIGERLARIGGAGDQKVYPLDIQFEPDPKFTVLDIEGQDTPAFLFTLTNALNLHGIMLHKMHIATQNGKVHDRFWLSNRQGLAITSPESLERLKSTVALIKQFSTFLPHASNYDTALRNFYAFLNNYLVDEDKRNQLMQVEPEKLMALMAKVFGTGNFLWEEFTRMQVQHLLPLLRNVESLRRKKSKNKILSEIEACVEKHRDLDDQIEALNRYKDEELFRMDLAHLVHVEVTFQDFSEQLSLLAECTMGQMIELIARKLYKRKNLEFDEERYCGFALVALGKFGGREIGYASDLELGLIYQEDETFPEQQDFFDRMVKEIAKSYKAKTDGIFEIDWRLRPYGSDGPASASMRRWEKYYQIGGAAHDIERQALTRLRPIYGDKKLCQKLIQTRDGIIYQGFVPDRSEFLRLRQSQVDSHVKSGSVNAKYSPGGLVELEYTLQFLQLEHGAQWESLRAPNHVQLLENLLGQKLIRPTEFEKLYNAYAFQRRLINALRMVRGHAKDLVLPKQGSEEWTFLARRLGYAADREGLFGRFESDLKDHFHSVSVFYNAYFRPELPREEFKSGLPELITGEAKYDDTEEILTRLGVEDYNKVSQALRRLYDMSEHKDALLAVLVQFSRHLELSPDPEGALLAFEKFLSNADEDPLVLQKLIFQPTAIEWLATVFGQSEFLTNFLVNDSRVLLELAESGEVNSAKNQAQFRSELQKLFMLELEAEDRFDKARWYRNREYLRIGLRDFHLGVPFPRLVAEIAALSQALCAEIYDQVFRHAEELDLASKQCVIAFGKLGGGELNYSSDIDIVFVTTQEMSGDEKMRIEKLNMKFCKVLSAITRYGQLFRVDTTLRPYGQQGGLVANSEHYRRYYSSEAQGWELQIWLKASVLCGDQEGGQGLIQEMRTHATNPENRAGIQATVTHMRLKKLEILHKKEQLFREVKSGPGGIRTPEFFVQALQIEHGREIPAIITGNTWLALRALHKEDLITKEERDLLSEHYVFLRTVEHRLQLYAMQQAHLLPESKVEFKKLALRMGYRPQLGEDPSSQFRRDLERAYQELLEFHYKLYPKIRVDEW